MAFQSMLSGAECSASNNTLSQFLKHTQTDRSLQQDAMQGQPGLATRPGFRTRPGPGGAAGDMEAFMRQRDAPGMPFDMQAMRAEMDSMRAGLGGPQQLRQPSGGAPNAWAQEMQQHAPAKAGMGASAGWSEQFQHGVPAGGAGPMSSMMREDGIPARHGMYGGSGAGMYMGAGPMGMRSFMPRPPMAQETHTSTMPDRIVELDQAKWDEQFRKLEEEAAAAEAQTADAKGKGKEALTEEEEQGLKELEEMRARLHDEVQDDNPRFEELWNALKDPSVLEKSDDLAKWEEKLMEAIAAEDPLNSTHPGGGLGPGALGLEELDGLDETEARLRRELGDVDENGFPLLGTYQFDETNPYIDHKTPYAEGMRLVENNGSLTDAALLFEAAAQRDAEQVAGDELELTRAERSRAWQRLGECHAMNEHEEKAIQALEEALRIDANNLEAYMSLSVSYINEGYDQAANNTLLRYIARSHPHIAPHSEFPTLKDEAVNPWARLNYVRELFLKAARENAAQGRMDPDIQIGLGLLFYSSSSYDQAKDCFQAALESRPNDWQLWNRLGATLANGGNPEMATEAYHKALELRPTFTRAIYNLSVSCLNLGAHHEAAEHLLSALTLQRSQPIPDAPEGTNHMPPLSHVQESESLWNTLRSIMVIMNRMDLANQCHVGSDLAPFRQAGFEF